MCEQECKEQSTKTKAQREHECVFVWDASEIYMLVEEELKESIFFFFSRLQKKLLLSWLWHNCVRMKILFFILITFCIEKEYLDISWIIDKSLYNWLQFLGVCMWSCVWVALFTLSVCFSALAGRWVSIRAEA